MDQCIPSDIANAPSLPMSNVPHPMVNAPLSLPGFFRVIEMYFAFFL